MSQRNADSEAPAPPRLRREKKTVRAMIRIFCRDSHSADDRAGQPLCPACQELLDYASCRIDRCPFGEQKPTCANCPIHCYKPEMRQRIRDVMRHAGPRMLTRHPVLAIMHLLVDGRRKPPQRLKNRLSQ